MSQPVQKLPRTPDIEAQRMAMKELYFLIGNWSGTARVLRGPGEPVELIQTEKARYELDGLLLVIEGTGRAKADGKLALQALGIISFDDEAGVYRMRAFNDGRWLETEIKLLDDPKGMTWGFALGEIKTASTLRINEKGEWTEHADLTIGSQPPRTLLELSVRRAQ